MKKLLNLLALLLLPFCMTMAQEKNGFYVDFGAGFSNELHFNFAQLTPGFGYKFSNQWAAGFRTTYQTTDSSPEALVYTPYVSYTFLRFGKLGIGTDGMVSFATKKANCDDTMDLNYKPYRPPFFEGGLNVGATYDVSRHFGVFVKGLFLGYSNTEYTHKGAVLGNGRFVFDANWRRVMLGARVVF